MPECLLPSVACSKSAARAGCLPVFDGISTVSLPTPLKPKSPLPSQPTTSSKSSKQAKTTGRSVERYLAPAPPKNGRVIGVDCHPDTFTAAIFKGQTPHDAQKLGTKANLTFAGLIEWAKATCTALDLFLLEAGGNSFALCEALAKVGLRSVVLESQHVGHHAKIYADNDAIAAERIALVYLAGRTPAVWVPDARTRELRELLHGYQNAVSNHTAAGNALKGYLNGHAIRLAGRKLKASSTRSWVEAQRAWSPLQKQMLDLYFTEFRQTTERRTAYERLICTQIAEDPLMLRCMRLLGIGKINAFATVAVVGDVNRFAGPEKLVTYLGLNPGQRQSGNDKHIKVGIGQRGRGDLRQLLIQGAQAVLRNANASPLGKWGRQLFARKGNRNVAVAAIARKMAVQLWHLLRGNPPTALEIDQRFTFKLDRLAIAIGAALRPTIGLGSSLAEALTILLERSRGLNCAPPPPKLLKPV